MDPAEWAAGLAHIGADGIVVALLEGVQSGGAIKQRVLSSRVILLEDTKPNPETVVFVCRVLQEYAEDLVWY